MRRDLILIEHGPERARVDRALAPLVLALWQLGIRTTRSGAHHPQSGKAWIEFATSRDAERFLDLATADAPVGDRVWRRLDAWRFHPITGAPTSRAGGAAPHAWELHCSAVATNRNDAGEPVDVEWDGAAFAIGVVVGIPTRDLPAVVTHISTIALQQVDNRQRGSSPTAV